MKKGGQVNIGTSETGLVRWDLSQKIGVCAHFGGWKITCMRGFSSLLCDNGPQNPDCMPGLLKQASLEGGLENELGPSGRIGVKGWRWGKGMQRLRSRPRVGVG